MTFDDMMRQLLGLSMGQSSDTNYLDQANIPQQTPSSTSGGGDIEAILSAVLGNNGAGTTPTTTSPYSYNELWGIAPGSGPVFRTRNVPWQEIWNQIEDTPQNRARLLHSVPPPPGFVYTLHENYNPNFSGYRMHPEWYGLPKTAPSTQPSRQPYSSPGGLRGPLPPAPLPKKQGTGTLSTGVKF